LEENDTPSFLPFASFAFFAPLREELQDSRAAGADKNSFFLSYLLPFIFSFAKKVTVTFLS
jgi:hypothetical protein